MKKISAGIIIQNSKGEILLLLRDDKPSIPYPNQWYILGGGVEAGETPEEAVRREMMEEMELELKLKEFALFKVYDWPDKKEYVYCTDIDLDLAHTPLHEGQKIRYFSEREIENMTLGFHDGEIAKEYFGYKKRI